MKKLIGTCGFILGLLVIIGPLLAAEVPDNLSKRSAANLYLTATEAYAFKKRFSDRVLFVDIRSPAEIMFVGMPDSMDINIPLLSPDYSQWNEIKRSYPMERNDKFNMQIDEAINARNMTQKDSIVLLCRSGKRSAKAASLLHSRGYVQVYTVVDGFEGDKVKTGMNKGKRMVNGWKNSELPWGYKLDRNKVSFIQ